MLALVLAALGALLVARARADTLRWMQPGSVAATGYHVVVEYRPLEAPVRLDDASQQIWAVDYPDPRRPYAWNMCALWAGGPCVWSANGPAHRVPAICRLDSGNGVLDLVDVLAALRSWSLPDVVAVIGSLGVLCK